MSFQFTRDGHTYRVHTEVGDGPARVVVDELEQHGAQSGEQHGEESAS